MDFKSQLQALQGKMLTIYIVGSNEEFAGTLLSVGTDFVTLEAQPDDAPHKAQSLIAIAAISCVSYRS
jgi:hypothetical protein